MMMDKQDTYIDRRLFYHAVVCSVWLFLTIGVMVPGMGNSSPRSALKIAASGSIDGCMVARQECVADLFSSVRHEIVKRGSHEAEMAAGEYVVASSFTSPDNAKRFAEGLRKLDFNARYGYLTEKNLWFVYILKTGDPRRARAEQARVSKMFLLRDAWLLTVEGG